MRQIRTLVADIFFFCLIVLLILVSLFSYQRIARSNSAYDWVNHTAFIKLKLEQVSSSINSAETAQRGFLLTKDSSFLKPYAGAEEKTLGFIRDLDSLTADNYPEQVNVLALKRLAALLYERLRYNLEFRDRPIDQAYPFLADGNRYMNQIRNKIGEMILIEDALLKKRTADKNRNASLNPLYTLFFSILGIIIVTVVYFRLRSETRLRLRAEESEAAIHKFFMQVPAMVAILKGPAHQFEFANPSYLELIGQRDIIGKKIREVLPEIESQGHFGLLDQVYRSRQTFTAREMPFQRKGTGRVDSVFINFTYQAIVNVRGNVEGILVFCYDVSEMVDNRKKVEETEQRLRLAIEAADIGTFDWDFANEKFLSSQRLTTIFGFEDPVNTTHLDLLSTFHPADKPIRDKAVENSFSKGALSYEARIIWPDHSIHCINVYGKIVYDDDRKPLRMYGTVLDITAQKAILEEIRESEKRFRLLANSMPQQIWTADESGNLDYFNEAVFRFTGLSAADMENGGWINVIHPGDRAENKKKWMHSVQSGEEFFMEHRFRNSIGTYRWQLSRALPQKDSLGKIQRWVGTSTDIQDQRNFMEELEKQVNERTKSLKQANINLENTVHELERINGELESFNYIASHDLQEPLRKIIAFSQRITDREQNNLTDFSRNYFSRITAAASRMQNLIDAFLSYSSNTDSHSHFEEVDLNALLGEVKNDLSNMMEEKSVRIVAADLPTLKVIRIQFYQLFINLISNSVKYSRPGVEPCIRISSSRVDASSINSADAEPGTIYARINFADNGIGFEQQYVSKIFQLFQRLHGKGEYAGTGIGLAICKKIVGNHRGFIFAVGEPGVGAVFTLFIPLNREH